MRRRVIMMVGIFMALFGAASVASPPPASAAATTLFCTISNWTAVDLPYGTVMLEYRPCSYYPVRPNIPIGEVHEFGVCNVRPSLTAEADFLDCLWHGYLDWPDDIVQRMYNTRGQYACLITDQELFRGRYIAMLACGEKDAVVRAIYGY